VDHVLADVDDWPVEAVAVGVSGPDATIATHGPADRTFWWASITKILTAWATLVAVQDGLLHLDEPAGPEGATVRHLLSHASGLPPQTGGPTARVEYRRIYSNHGYELLADLVADRVGLSFAEHLDIEVLQPLGMTTTYLEGSPAADVHGTAGDLLLLARELLAPTLLDEPLASEVAQVQFPGLRGVLPSYGRQDDNAWGLGPEIRAAKSPHWTGPSQPPDTFGHFGMSGSFLWINRDAGVAAGCLTDGEFGQWAIDAWAPFNERVWRAATGR
jgi:CubicO group peptidase (beta-lactamase class C family)